MNEKKLQQFDSSSDELDLWSNKDNAEFYENVPISFLLENIERLGLESAPDVELISEYVARADSVLDVGAGTGRVIDALLEKKYSGDIFAIERSKKLFSHLTEVYSDKVNLIHGDVLQHEFTQKFDVILCMWSGITDFSKDEQLLLLSRLTAFLRPGGKLILESLSPDFFPINTHNVTKLQANVFQFNFNDFSTMIFIPNEALILSYVSQVNLASCVSLSYKTNKKINRNIYILS